MFTRQFLAMMSTFTLVTGALLVGDALNGTVVTGTYGITSPASVFRVVPGIVLIWIGYTLRENKEKFVSAYFAGRDAAAKSKQESSDGEFDEQMSPLSGDGLENLEARKGDTDDNE
ncbi:hypothetical protein SAMN05421858_1186 [Haladaptatus litoreus]|uniref:Uncharacterized protein n=1 Tax=Haladaptatus litoreus TaxID=553468 RepID=A0A1N6XLR6_9EURY|nr:hypothetical protein [Haladaptatus litoreus]SIR03304.1 hypothetical protein SAMN05421858_1186 [Haladaptatus litoreus]